MADTDIKLPIIKIEKVWHIGSLKKGEKGARGSSYEGNLLSVSPCPEAWQQICRMGGKELYQSSRAVTMLDMNTILYSQDAQAERLRKHIIKEGKASGSIVKRDMWKASYYDDELDREVYALFDSLDALREEYPDEEYVEVSRESGHFSSRDVLLKHGWSADGIHEIDFAIIEWARENGLDGVYWDEELDISGYSAPRGGFFDQGIDTLIACEVMPDNDEGMEGVGPVEWISPPSYKRALRWVDTDPSP